MKPFIRSAYNYDMATASVSHSTRNDEVSLTRQADAADTDINTLVRRFGITGMLAQIPMPPSYQDFDQIFDFQSAQNTIRAATESFNALPADTRSRFNNNPHLFVEFCQDEKNLPELRKLGLAVPEKPAIVPPEPMLVRVVADAPPKP